MHSSVRHSSDEGVLGEAVFAEQEQHSLAFSGEELSFLASLIPSLEIIFAADAIVVVVLIFIWLFLIDFASTPLVVVDISMIMANNTNINTHHKNKEILS